MRRRVRRLRVCLRCRLRHRGGVLRRSGRHLIRFFASNRRGRIRRCHCSRLVVRRDLRSVPRIGRISGDRGRGFYACRRNRILRTCRCILRCSGRWRNDARTRCGQLGHASQLWFRDRLGDPRGVRGSRRGGSCLPRQLLARPCQIGLAREVTRHPVDVDRAAAREGSTDYGEEKAGKQRVKSEHGRYSNNRCPKKLRKKTN